MLLILITLYYITSTTLSFVYSFLLSKNGLKYPILFSAVQNMWQVVFSFLFERVGRKFLRSEIEKESEECKEENKKECKVENKKECKEENKKECKEENREELIEQKIILENNEKTVLENNEKILKNNEKILENNKDLNKQKILSNKKQILSENSEQLLPKTKENTLLNTHPLKPLTHYKSYLYTTLYLLPCTLTGVLDILLSTLSLQNVSLALYTMMKSSSPIFILLSSFLINNEPVSFISFFIIALIGTGTFLLTYKKCTSYDNYSYLILIVTLISAIRWSFIQKYLEKEKCTFKFLRKVNFNMSLKLFVYSLFVENKNYSIILKNLLSLLPITFLISFFSFLLIIIEFQILLNFSSIFLSILGIFKELTIILISVYFTDNIRLDGVNWSGLVVCMVGLVLYSVFRGSKSEKRK